LGFFEGLLKTIGNFLAPYIEKYISLDARKFLMKKYAKCGGGLSS